MPTAAELALHITAKNDASKALDDVSKSAGGLGKSLGDVGKIAGGVLAAGAITAGAGALVGGLKSAIGAASDANETLSKSNTVFKGNAAEIEQWASGAAKAFGQSKTQALASASSFGNMFSQIGINIPQAAKMSTAMTELASDFASFHNADITEVLAAQEAAFRGEYDSVQKFVPTINAAAVETEALAASGKKNAKELTAQEKAMATFTLLTKGAGEAAGDFARTSDGLANRQRALGAQMDNLKVTIGNFLLPIMTELAGVALEVVIPAISKLANILGSTIGPVISKAAGAVRNFLTAMRGGGNAMDSFGKSASSVAGPLSGLAAFIAGLIPKITATFDKLKQYWATELQPAFQNLVTAGKAAVEGLLAAFEFILPIIQPIFDQLLNVIETWVGIVGNAFAIIIDLIQGDWAGAWKNFQDLIRVAIEFVQETIQNFAALASNILGALWQGIQLAAGLAWDGIKALIAAAVDEIVASAEHMASEAGRIIGSIPETVAGLAGAALNAARQLGANLWLGIKDEIDDLPATMIQIGRDIINGLVQGISDSAHSVYNKAREVANGIINAAKGLFQTGSPSRVFHQMGVDTIQGLINGINSMEDDARLAAADLAREVANAAGRELFEDMSIGAPIVGRQSLPNIVSGSAWNANNISTEQGRALQNAINMGYNIPPELRGIVPQLQSGMPYVPNDGLAYLHRGERVVPANQNGWGASVTVNVNGPVYARDEDEVRHFGNDSAWALIAGLKARGVRI